MFVGREEELATLQNLYGSNRFEMLVLYGRRRVGKTALLEEFCASKPAIMFTAQAQADGDNLTDFSRAIASFFGMPESTPSFASWMDALNYVGEKAKEANLILVFDEFPYAAKSNPALASVFQIAIDKVLSKTRMLLVLCGSNQGFMENEVLSEKSPLYGRRTSQLKLRPFDYFDAARMLPGCSPEERVSYYASLGGTPYYLAGVQEGKTYVENMADLFFSRVGLMFDEPMMLLRQELREPAVYGSILRALASGCTRVGQIADRSGVAATSLAFYLKTLTDLGLVERAVPFGEGERSKRALYRVSDPAFLFWYRFVAPYVSAVENGLGEDVARRLLSDERRNEYEGHLFERICRQWVVRQARAGALPLHPTAVGSWWGADPAAHEQTDIDVVAADDIDKVALLGECKWRNQFDESEALATLTNRQHLIGGYKERYLYLFTKRAVSETTRTTAALEKHMRCISVDEMYE